MTVQNRIGIDLGGTKISGVLLGPAGNALDHKRVKTPANDYAETLRVIKSLVEELGHLRTGQTTVGIAIPGSISPSSGLVQNANSTCLNGMPLKMDLERTLGKPVRIANDANCFAISEAFDGSGAEFDTVFGVILGTGCGGGLIYKKQIIDGPRGIGGEWGHTPLPSPELDELPGPKCWCGRRGCIETWVSGPALAANHASHFGGALTAKSIASKAADGHIECTTSLQNYISRLARGLATVINIIDPDCIVLGGGLSNISLLYEQLPAAIAPHVFAEKQDVLIRPPHFGDDSGVRGAAWLWDRPKINED